MIRFIFIFPAWYRACFYHKDKGFRKFLEEEFSWSNTCHEAHMMTNGTNDFYHTWFKMILGVPWFFLIRRNSTAEKDFNDIELKFYLWRKRQP